MKFLICVLCINQADENELRSRVIKKAKRKAVVSNEDGPGTTVFKGFTGQ